MVAKARIHSFNHNPVKQGPVIYWMQRDQRVHDNWAILFAQEKSIELKQSLLVIFCLVNDFLGATDRHFHFMLRGLRKVSKEFERFNIPFFILRGDPEILIPEFISKVNASILVTDFNPLRLTMKWRMEVNQKLNIPFYEVDAHNIIPCRFVSDKQEFGARTLRTKIQKQLPEFLVPFPRLIKHPFPWSLKADTSAINHLPYKDIGQDFELTDGSENILSFFLKEKLKNYHLKRNFPEHNGQSNLSPYFHFGQISAQRVALEVQAAEAPAESKNAFLEELIVRRELSDNYCLYNPDYDRFEGFPVWAKKTLNLHRSDPRGYCYELPVFENAETHDDLWNAAQKEMIITGKMHGYMRMYWAKKILEWTDSPEEAVAVAIYLNDKYELDGRDPNGYAGIAWAIGGVHDRPWLERPVFGMIRYMNYQGCLRKFNVKEYIRKVNAL